MRAKEFKNNLKTIKNQLKGMTLQLCQPKSFVPHKTLKSFGLAILEAEKLYNGFFINWVWTTEGLKYIGGFDELRAMLNTGIVTGVSFKAQYVPADFGEWMRIEGGLD